ncbi:MAG TPA: bifunctional riboflavin kinase/FAD synthetase [Candidatus Hydrogenedentes bacterium]|nr:bifunctional riboflavin kinase/FAD synthetase [Candidatus Hydrogenedentota bacterium]HOV76024.1 bifunctional riboflavin kinase/FAD synthetase [Candidatus Hydrogenedentota bacterium]HPC18246.1 bifunctional riboflavin kinase/FAD synthetase [Candidatus Hydrogenedentota bacterium]HRT21886.1 bifunctional riboflavin kinase/FAD synthetase [Candidatus Hydrogenedentota bacterium]HRT66628.1 bifunctional riboflavin kinase/FAD synthetase [Candidatus Hydrogenedentota bacterium]
MRIVEDISTFKETFPYLVLTIGSFDGVHKGHRRVLAEVVSRARTQNGTAAVLTVCPHPREFFSPTHAPNLLTNNRKKYELLAEAGIDVVFVLHFDETLASMDREVFVARIIHGLCRAREVIVGHDFAFGRDATGNYAYLAETGPAYGFTTCEIPPLMIDGERVSSTAIRERVLEGDLDEAEALLGRKYSVTGEVVTGRGIGRTLGFPTANVKPLHTAIPAQGVYAAEVLVDGRRHPAAVNVGVAPTIRQDETVIEAFLLNFEGDLHGKPIEIVFHKRIRPEKKFASHDELIAAIQRDVQTIDAFFRSNHQTQPQNEGT